jgi:radical SAM superfamily enzyme YgiQ (UPF0313 family)
MISANRGLLPVLEQDDLVSSVEVPVGVKRVVVLLIKPSHYDDDGFVYRFRKGVLPSTSLQVVYELTWRALEHILRDDVAIEVHMFEDIIGAQADEINSLASNFPEKGTKLIVGLVGVQTSQFPRACDLMKYWQEKGATCVIGGAHVTGSISTLLDGVADAGRPDIPCPHDMPFEIEDILLNGVVVFHGEAESESMKSSVWARALADMIEGHPKEIYRGGKPDITAAPLPEYSAEHLRSFVCPIRTLDDSRGCPHRCTFCAVINIQGRRMRCRDPVEIVNYARRLCDEEGRAIFFFCGDNFARNTRWREILDGLIELREQGCQISFMIQADLACGKISGFIPKLAAAGCTNIFFGVESLNPKNLKDAHKSHNRVEEYRTLWAECHRLGIIVQVSYIIGFPRDTPESIRRDVDELFELGAQQASFSVLLPNPGSEDYARSIVAGEPIDDDLNRHDFLRPVMDHPVMTREEWLAAYQDAWRRFYKPANMIAALKRFSNREDRRRLRSKLLWYRWGIRAERTHPMTAGLYRIRSYQERRPGSPPLSYSKFLFLEMWRHMRYVGLFLAEFFVFQHVVFEMELGPGIAKRKDKMTDRVRGVWDWLRRTFGKTPSRRWLNNFWVRYGSNKWWLLAPWCWWRHLIALPFAFSEVVYSIRFVIMSRLIWRDLSR